MSSYILFDSRRQEHRQTILYRLPISSNQMNWPPSIVVTIQSALSIAMVCRYQPISFVGCTGVNQSAVSVITLYRSQPISCLRHYMLYRYQPISCLCYYIIKISANQLCQSVCCTDLNQSAVSVIMLYWYKPISCLGHYNTDTSQSAASVIMLYRYQPISCLGHYVIQIPSNQLPRPFCCTDIKQSGLTILLFTFSSNFTKV